MWSVLTFTVWNEEDRNICAMPSPCFQCSGSGSVGSVSFWAPWIQIRVRFYLYGSGTHNLLYKQKLRKTQFLQYCDFYLTFCFKDSLKCTYGKHLVSKQKQIRKNRLLFCHLVSYGTLLKKQVGSGSLIKRNFYCK
jgi:hypothetical protein